MHRVLSIASGDFYSHYLWQPCLYVPSLLSQTGLFKSLSCQVIYAQCDNMGSRSPAEIIFLRGILVCPAGTVLCQKGDQCAELQENQKGKESDIPLKEAISSCMQWDAVLVGFSWPSKGDPLQGQAERSYLLLWATGLADTILFFQLKNPWGSF